MKNLSKNKEILNLAIPSTVENILHALVGFIDTWMISRIGLAAITAVGIANNLITVYLAVFIAIATGSSSLIARFHGEKNNEGINDTALNAIILAIVTGIFFGFATLVLGKTVLFYMGAEGVVLTEGTVFLNIVGGSSIFISLITVLGAIIRATGDTKTPMVVNTAVNILNIILDYILIFGWGWIPPLGVMGTAIGTVFSRGIGCLFLFLQLEKKGIVFERSELFRLRKYRELIHLSIPAALERLVMRLGQVLYYSLIITIGVKTYAAHTIAGNIESFFYMPAFGLSTAASILMGNSMGRKDRAGAEDYCKRLLRYGFLFALLSGLLLFFGGEFAAGAFTEDGEALEKVKIALRIDAFAQIPLALSIIITGALQGMGDTKSPLYSTVIGMWGMRVIGVYLLGVYLRMDIAGIWISILIDLTIRAIFLYTVFKNKIKTINHKEKSSGEIQ